MSLIIYHRRLIKRKVSAETLDSLKLESPVVSSGASRLTKTYFHMPCTHPPPTQRDVDGGALGEGLAYQVLTMRFACLINDSQMRQDCGPNKVFG